MWHAQTIGAYARTSQEAYDNAVETWNTLGSLGWTLNAVCGLLGSQEWEGGYNPWRWQYDQVLSITDTQTIATSRNHGYGLVQFTPAGKYIYDTNAQAFSEYNPNFSDHAGQPTDGIAQLKFINGYADYYSTTAYPLSYSDFKASTQTPEYLASAWLYNYERPGDPSATESDRRTAARYWYQVLQGLPPVPPVPTGSSKFKWWLYTRRRF